MDIVENRKPKLTRVSLQVAEKASSDGATNKQCFIDDQKDIKTTITKLSTDLDDIQKPTLSRVSVDVAEEASTDGTINYQCLSDDQNYKKTTSRKMPMDYLEVPEPSLTWGFLELAFTQILPQTAGMTRPVVVTVAEDRHSSLNDGATMAPRRFTKTNIPVLCAGRCSPVDTMGQAGPGDETERSVLSGSESEERGSDPVGPVGPYVTFDQVAHISHLARWARTGSIPHVIPIMDPDRKKKLKEPILLAQWARTSRLTKLPIYHT